MTLATPPWLAKLDTQKNFSIYLLVSGEVISVVTIQEHEGSQHPIYFASQILHEAETRYQLIEKVALALVHTTRCLRKYFQSHQVVVRINLPIPKVLRKPKLPERMMV